MMKKTKARARAKPQDATREAQKKPLASGLRKRLAQRKELTLRFFRRLTGTLCALVIITGLAYGAVELRNSLDQPITKVKVAGDLQYIQRSDIARWIKGQVTEGVLTTDLKSIQAHLQAQPWVAQVTVRRQWPGILQVSLVEHVAIAHWNKGALLTAQGTIFEPEQDVSELDLPRLDGADQYALEVFKKYQWVSAQLDELELEVMQLTKQQRGTWCVTLKPFTLVKQGEQLASEAGIDVYMGKLELEEKIARFKALYNKELLEQMDDIVRIDLRYTNGIAVQWKSKPAVS